MTKNIFTICVSLNDIDDGISPDARCEELIECITRTNDFTREELDGQTNFIFCEDLLFERNKQQTTRHRRWE